MRFPTLRRVASAGLALVVLVSSLTCMTVACRLVCTAGETAKVATTAAPADLPPCHRAAAGASSTAPAKVPAGDCGAGTVCCSTWLHDRGVYTLPAPILVPGPVTDDAPALAVATFAPDAHLAPGATGPPPPDLLAAPLESVVSSRASRAPPAA